MDISKEDLDKAVVNSGLSTADAALIWSELLSSHRHPEKSKFGFANVAYYLGALIVIGAMGWFMGVGWEIWQGGFIVIVSILYGIAFALAGRTLWKDQATKIPGGLLFTMAVCMTPLATYGVERWTGFWPASDPGTFDRFHPYIHGSWIIMEITTVLAGIIALKFIRFPFLTAPVAYSLWFMSMDLIELIGGHADMDWSEKEVISMVFGAIMLIGTYVVDLKGKASDFAFWGYLFGLLAFWGGLSSMHSGNEWAKFGYCLINLMLILLSLILRRRVFIIFGSLGICGYLGHLALDHFKNSVLFPMVLTMIGLAILYLGVLYQKHRIKLETNFREMILPHIGNLIPARALAEAAPEKQS